MNAHVRHLNVAAPANPEKPATFEDYAKMKFRAWKHREGEWEPPSNDEWAKLANPHLISVRIAWFTMCKTRAEIIEMFSKPDSDDVMEEMLKMLDQSQKYFEGLARLLEAAQLRVLCGGTAFEFTQADHCDSAANKKARGKRVA